LKPNFLGLGAQKSGTTTLDTIFRSHPQIFVPVYRKEAHFFDDMAKYQHGYTQYLLEFFGEVTGEIAVGEISPSYLCDPDCRDRIFDTLGSETKFIVQLRHPVSRALSHYKMNLNWLRESSTFLDTIQDEGALLSRMPWLYKRYGYLHRGRYLDQIKHYLERFELEQFHFIVFEEMVAKPAVVLKGCFDFLGVSNLEGLTLPVSNTETKLKLHKIDDRTTIQIHEGGRTRSIELNEGAWIIETDASGKLRVFPRPDAVLDRHLQKVMALLGQEYPSKDELADLYDRFFKEQEGELSELLGADLSEWWS